MSSEKNPTDTTVPAHHEASADHVADYDSATADRNVNVNLPAGWKYKQWRLFGHSSWYASPQTQLIMVSFVCFLCPGMFNALGGMGGGGKTDATLADNMVS